MNQKWGLLFLVSFSMALGGFSSALAQPPTHQLVGRVVSIVDGDTIVVLTGGTSRTRIHLNGVECPELRQPFGQMAKQFTSKKLVGKDIDVTVSGADAKGDLLGEITDPERPGVIINQSLVKNGYAWWDRKNAPDDAVLKQMETEARAAKRGLWAKKAVAPWDWRAGKR